MIRFIIQHHECDHNTGLDRKDFITIDAEVPQLERLLREGGRGEMGFKHCQVMGAEILDSAELLEPLPSWKPCNPGCDPEFNGSRSRLCADICDAARTALAAHRQQSADTVTDGFKGIPDLPHGFNHCAYNRQTGEWLYINHANTWQLFQGPSHDGEQAERDALVEALEEGLRAIGDHHAPGDCYATGPMTGDHFRDLVQCPACSFIAMCDDLLADHRKGGCK